MRTVNNKFAIIPHRCNRCGYTFWLEPYKKQQTIGKDIGGTIYEERICSRCSKRLNIK